MNRNDISTRVCHIFFVTAKYVYRKTTSNQTMKVVNLFKIVGGVILRLNKGNIVTLFVEVPTRNYLGFNLFSFYVTLFLPYF